MNIAQLSASVTGPPRYAGSGIPVSANLAAPTSPCDGSCVPPGATLDPNSWGYLTQLQYYHDWYGDGAHNDKGWG